LRLTAVAAATTGHHHANDTQPSKTT